jgi:hypothetical protein
VEQIVTNLRRRLCLRLKGFIPDYGNPNRTSCTSRVFPGASHVPSMVHGLCTDWELWSSLGKRPVARLALEERWPEGDVWSKRVPEFKVRLQHVRLAAATCASAVPLHKASAWSRSA